MASFKHTNLFLGFFLTGDLKEEVSGDLEEAFLLRTERKGLFYAKLFLAWELLISLRLTNRKFIKLKIGRFMFFKNFIKTGFRFIWKTRRYSLVNILGLTLGITVAGYTWLFVSDQFSFDSFHEHSSNTYRIGLNIDFKGEQEAFAGASFVMGEEFREQVTGVVAASQVKSGFPLLVRGSETENFMCHFVHKDIFRVLDFDFIQGGPENFGDPASILVSKSFYARMSAPETVEFIFNGDRHVFQVIGIYEDVPTNSSIRPEVLVSTAFYPNLVPERRLTTWMDINMNVLVRLEEGANQQDVARSMTALIPNEDPLTVDVFLQPITDIHTNVDLGAGNGIAGTMDEDVLKVLVFTGILCLLISTFNFANFSVGNYLKRVKEVGIRKAIGADRSIIFSQFLIEVSINVILGTALALILQVILVAQFSSYIEVDYSVGSFMTFRYMIGIMGVAVLAILLSGIFPAVFLSGMNVLKALRGYKFMAHRRPMSKLFLAFQAALSVFMLLVTFTTQKQLTYLLDFDLGYDDQNVIFARLQNRDQVPMLKNELLRIPGVNKVSFNSGYNGTRLTGEYDHISTRHLHVDPDFSDMMDLQIIKGRNLSTEIVTDEMGAVLINETLEKQLGFGEAIGQTLPFDYGVLKEPTIVGVVKDYHFQSPRFSNQPLVMYLAPAYPFQNLFVETTSEDPRIVDRVAEVYEQICAPFGFQYSWLSDSNAQALDSESKVSKVSFIGSVIAIFLSALGLLGVLGTNIEKRLKEVTIHKINGASVGALYSIFFRNFLPWLAFGLVAGLFPAFYFMNEWLESYANRIALSWDLFVIGIMACSTVFLLVMLIQLSRINRLNPVNFLRDE